MCDRDSTLVAEVSACAAEAMIVRQGYARITANDGGGAYRLTELSWTGTADADGQAPGQLSAAAARDFQNRASGQIGEAVIWWQQYRRDGALETLIDVGSAHALPQPAGSGGSLVVINSGGTGYTTLPGAVGQVPYFSGGAWSAAPLASLAGEMCVTRRLKLTPGSADGTCLFDGRDWRGRLLLPVFYVVWQNEPNDFAGSGNVQSIVQTPPAFEGLLGGPGWDVLAGDSSGGAYVKVEMELDSGNLRWNWSGLGNIAAYSIAAFGMLSLGRVAANDDVTP
ncbi:MAG: hypothetical protein ABFD92_16905 [Planctomycetaceae bacterium]|nr:hypothetical protein [Planctomycetaceae bacterium]